MGRYPVKPKESQTGKKQALPRFSDEKRLRDLEKWKKDTAEEFRKIEQIEVNIKADIIEYNFQTIALIIALLALIVVIPLGLITKFDLTDSVKINIILVTLIVIAFLLIVLVRIWGVKHFKKRRRIDGNYKEILTIERVE